MSSYGEDGSVVRTVVPGQCVARNVMYRRDELSRFAEARRYDRSGGSTRSLSLAVRQRDDPGYQRTATGPTRRWPRKVSLLLMAFTAFSCGPRLVLPASTNTSSPPFSHGGSIPSAPSMHPRHGLLAVDSNRVCWASEKNIYCASTAAPTAWSWVAQMGSDIVRLEMGLASLCAQDVTTRMTCWRTLPHSVGVEPVPSLQRSDVTLWSADMHLCLTETVQPNRVVCLNEDPIAFPIPITELGDMCAVLDDQSLWCWGPSADCNLGPHCLVARCPPVRVPLPAVEVSGSLGRCAVLATDEVACFGFSPEIGFGEVYDTCATRGGVYIRLPARVADLRVAPAAACALTVDDDLYCWGSRIHEPLRSRGANWDQAVLVGVGIQAFDLHADYYHFALCFASTAGGIECPYDLR